MVSGSSIFKTLCLFGGICFHFTLLAQKNDTVYLLNGDRLTGEIKKFEYGILTLSTDAMQTISIEYDRINTGYSDKYFDIRTSSGQRYYGKLAKSQVPGIINLVISDDTIPKPIIDIIEFMTIKNQFWKRLDGSVNLGLSYTKSSDVFQYNLGAKISNRTTRWYSQFSLSSILTDQPEKSTSKKNDVTVNISRLLSGPWFVGAQAMGQENTELNLAHRYQAGLGAGYDIVHTNSNRFYTIAGLFFNLEKTIDTQVESENFEGLLSLQYKWFKYRHPKINVTSGINAYPSFTVRGRIRLDANLDANFEIIKDLYFTLSLYDNFDSKPSEDQSSKNDWGVNTSIGYSF
ncbi:MAG: DUF481 domain-containing protein [Bacteroidales bacterium]|nr:DUF481 domain-containing protein [Bacteroidales bacterium]